MYLYLIFYNILSLVSLQFLKEEQKKNDPASVQRVSILVPILVLQWHGLLENPVSLSQRFHYGYHIEGHIIKRGVPCIFSDRVVAYVYTLKKISRNAVNKDAVCRIVEHVLFSACVLYMDSTMLQTASLGYKMNWRFFSQQRRY